jgi:serine/threonine-protein kinase
MDRIGRYQIAKELGRGAMGAVYQALDPQIDRTVAIKMILTSNLSPADLENYKQRFYREARAAGKMSHGGIVTIYDITEDAQGQPYLVMEFVEGRTLDQIMAELAARRERLLTAQALDIAIQVADALDYAHRRGVVHRDVKPANILLTGEGIAKIADFGIAKMEGVQLTQTGHMLGTPAFMSPEQFSGGEIDARSDLFSLGSILYWMLSGEKPFHADTLSMVTYKVVFADPPPPSQVNSALPPETDVVLARCLAKKPEARYASCKDLAEDLRALVVGKPVKATPLSDAEKTVVTAPVAAGNSSAPAPEKTVAQAPVALDRTVAAPAPAPPLERTLAAPVAVPPPPQAVARRRKLFTPRRLAAAGVLLLLLFVALAWKNRNAAVPSPSDEKVASRAEAERARAVEPPPEPVREPEVESGPPPHAKASSKARRSRSIFSGAKATLRVECWHNFRDGTLEISSAGKTLLRATLRGDAQDLGLVKIYSGVYRTSVEIPAGDHVFQVRARSVRSDYDEEDQIGGAFEEDGSRTLLIEFGKGSGLKVVNRKLTLRWK